MGLGNPGIKYKYTRHNIGFRALDKFRKENSFPAFKISKKFNSLISEGKLNNRKITLAEPQTFMNNSGRAVKKILNYCLSSENLIIVHDDIDIPLGKIRVSKRRSSAGHKGVESIIKEIESKDFTRIRIGIQPKTGKPENLKKFVLQKFSKEEEAILKNVLKKAVDAIIHTLKP